MIEQEELFLPPNFLAGNTSYRVFLYSFLITESQVPSAGRIDAKYVIAYMAYKAWHFIVDAKLSLGLPDRLNNLCTVLSKKFIDTPSLQDIEKELDNQVYIGILNDIKPVFTRFLSNWPNRKYAPYIAFQKDRILYIEINKAWSDFCLIYYDRCKQVYDEGLLRYLIKKNKDFDRIRKALDSDFIEPLKTITPSNDEQPSVEGVSSENLEILEQIPFSFLYESNDFCDCPAIQSLKYSPPEDCLSIKDILCANSHKRKYLTELTSYIVENQSRLIALHNFYSQKPQIPQCVLPGMPLGFMIQKFIQEYINRILLKIPLLPKRQQDSKKKRAEFFSILFDARRETYSSYDEIAEKYEMSKQRVKQILSGDNDIGLYSCKNILNGKYESKNFRVNPALFSTLLELQLSEFNAFPISLFDSKFGIIDEKTRNFILKITEWKLYASVGYIGSVVMRGGEIQVIIHALSEARRFMDEKILPISIEQELIPFFQTNFDFDNESINITCDLIRNSDYFESSCGDHQNKLYSLKWKNLLTVSSRLARILYERGEPMRVKEVYEEYNLRATRDGVHFENSPDWFTYRPHPYIVIQGKIGLWTFSLEGQKLLDKKKNARDAIKAYVKEHKGRAHFDEILHYMRENGYPHTENTIKAYLHEINRSKSSQLDKVPNKKNVKPFDGTDCSKGRRNIASIAIPIFIETINNLGKKTSIRNLKEAFEEKTGEKILDITARSIVNNHAEFRVEKDSFGNVSVSLTGVPYNQDHYITINDDYKETIKRSVIQILSKEEKHCKRLSLVFNMVCKLVPQSKHTNIVYTIIHKMSEIETYLVDGKKYIRLK